MGKPCSSVAQFMVRVCSPPTQKAVEGAGARRIPPAGLQKLVARLKRKLGEFEPKRRIGVGPTLPVRALPRPGTACELGEVVADGGGVRVGALQHVPTLPGKTALQLPKVFQEAPCCTRCCRCCWPSWGACWHQDPIMIPSSTYDNIRVPVPQFWTVVMNCCSSPSCNSNVSEGVHRAEILKCEGLNRRKNSQLDSITLALYMSEATPSHACYLRCDSVQKLLMGRRNYFCSQFQVSSALQFLSAFQPHLRTEFVLVQALWRVSVLTFKSQASQALPLIPSPEPPDLDDLQLVKITPLPEHKTTMYSPSSFLQIIFPEKIKDRTSSEEQISYVIPINKKPYTVHLEKRYFLADRFMVYLYNQGSMRSQSSDVLAQCYYQGNIKGYPNSVVTLNTCSGLRGILQFENESYGIEPLESSSTFQHIVYKLGNEDSELALFNKNSRNIETPTNYGIFINKKPESPSITSAPLYLEMNIVVDKTLYDYLGSDSMIVTNKIIEIISLINSVFAQLKVTVVLSSLELWSDKNKISTDGEADELLQRFLEWKQSYLTLRPHDVAYLFIYNEYPNYVGAAYPGKMCSARYSAGITMYPKNMTLETFSVVVAQMLGLGLGISYDDSTRCHCPETICLMDARALQHRGMKTFSNCSLSDFERFKSSMGAKCLQNKPQMQVGPRPVCGNGKVEENEICDCGSAQQCGPNSCCDPTTCVLKPGNACDSMSPSQTCCRRCQFLPQKHECRAKYHPICDLPEVCNGSSGYCPPDLTIHDGHICKAGGFICYKGNCPDQNEMCEKAYGTGSKNAPFACYEEIQGQTDRFGNCGKNQQNKYVFCGWRNLMCGRLICTYPSRLPYSPPNASSASVVYAFVRDQVCITVDFGLSSEDDPLKVPGGSICDHDRICLNSVCVESRFLKTNSETCTRKCNGHGVCNSLGDCHCESGFNPPNCEAEGGRAASLWFRKKDLYKEEDNGIEKKWLLSLYIVLIILTSAIIILTAWRGMKQRIFKEEESLSSETKSEGNTHTNVSK
ncbi:disintegrin and metalloproteinase domain-containing protein 32 [Psammomys obesus]|uniref:disintegrin and metalloproteinase domain-containing protein 32 n=1 Tax=Psammomys obesus TaxID=48139 RepID=UPI0024530F61|nr:disintegrin and metalloproteinase domain-containing protein 32 [Psammomys obesus]